VVGQASGTCNSQRECNHCNADVLSACRWRLGSGYAIDDPFGGTDLNDLHYYDPALQSWCWVAGNWLSVNDFADFGWGAFRQPVRAFARLPSWHGVSAGIDVKSQRIYFFGLTLFIRARSTPSEFETHGLNALHFMWFRLTGGASAGEGASAVWSVPRRVGAGKKSMSRMNLIILLSSSVGASQDVRHADK
jgi:hypothetical protein